MRSVVVDLEKKIQAAINTLPEQCRMVFKLSRFEEMKYAEIAKHFGWRGEIGIGFPGVVQGDVAISAPNLHPRFAGCHIGKLFRRETL